MENRKVFLRQPGRFTKQDILDKIYKPHNYDGLKASEDLEELVNETGRRQVAKNTAFVALAASMFCFFNLTRLWQLSPSGKRITVFCSVFFPYLSYNQFWYCNYFHKGGEK